MVEDGGEDGFLVLSLTMDGFSEASLIGDGVSGGSSMRIGLWKKVGP